MRTVLFVAILMATLNLAGQESRDIIRREIDLDGTGVDNELIIRNINGGIEVEGYSGRSVVVEVTRTIKAQGDEQRRKGQEEVQLGVVEKEGLVLLHLKTPCSIDNLQMKNREELTKDWGSLWQNNCNWEPAYDYRLDFRVKVPVGASIDVATVNEGNILIRGVGGALSANNVNGAITVEGAAGKTNVHTINGDVVITYDRNPGEDCRYYTLNGNIEATFRPGLKADLFFKSFNGDLYTDIGDVEIRPQLVKSKEAVKNGQGIAYKIDARQSIQLRGGGVKLDLETFNGNVYIKEK